MITQVILENYDDELIAETKSYTETKGMETLIKTVYGK